MARVRIVAQVVKDAAETYEEVRDDVWDTLMEVGLTDIDIIIEEES